VCAFQWLSANKAIQEYLDKSRQESCLVRYENIIAGPESRSAEIEKIFSFIGINRDAIGQLGLDKLPVVQATHLPIPERWRKREGVILPLIENPKIAKMCNRLGYDKGRAKEWL